MTAETSGRRPGSDTSADARWLGLGLVAALVILAILRIIFGGWAPLAPDDARYLSVGLSILDGRGPVTPSGSVFVLRSPIYGLALAVGSSVVGGDPLFGARLVALVLSLLALAGGVRLGWLLGGPGGAVGTALALVASALVWRLVPSLRIDIPQTAAIVATLLAVWRPTTRRWALGGVLLGVAILVKETALPVLILPLALVGSLPISRVARLGAVFVGAAALTAAWWWLVVCASTGEVFPLNAVSVIEARDVDAALRVDRSTALSLALVAVGWVVVAWRARSSRSERLLVVAAIGLTPAALYAASLGLNARNFAALAVLSAVAVGVGGAWLVGELRRRRGSARHAGWRRLATAALVGLAVVAITVPIIGQRDAGRIVPDRIGDQLAGWLAMNANGGERIVMSFRQREQMALRLRGDADVAVLPLTRVAATEPPADYLWMGLRDRQLFGYRRATWISALTDPPADLVALVGPHPFTPSALTASPDTAATLGLSPVTTIEADGDRAEVHRVDATTAATGTRDVPLHLSAAAAEAWLDVAGDGSSQRLVDAGAVVDGDAEEIGHLMARLGTNACALQARPGAVALAAAGTCPD
jgi:hypothetical protein